jgi:hypothetical protein
MTRSIDVSDLPLPLVAAIESLVDTYRERSKPASKKARPLGWLKGQWDVPESFFEPLPEELVNLFEGGNNKAS